MLREKINTRVLVIDDEEFVRDNIQDILTYRKAETNVQIAAASSLLFGEVANSEMPFSSATNLIFEVDKAANGMEGLEKAGRAITETRPYALIFIDMRMPGWDGLETTLKIRAIETRAEIIIITAFSDKSIEEIVAKAGRDVGYYCKPYTVEEILQLATKAIHNYTTLRNLEILIGIISDLSISKNHLDALLINILDQVAKYVNTDLAILIKWHENNVYEKLYSIGAAEDKINIAQIAKKIPMTYSNPEEVTQIDEFIFAKIDEYCIVAILKEDIQLKTEKIYLLRLFMQNALKAIRNAQLFEQMLKKEKLAAVGASMGMLVHDLRPPVINSQTIAGMIRKDGMDVKLLELLEKCTAQSVEIMNDFMDFLNENPIEKKRVNICALIKESIEMANSFRGKALFEIAATLDGDWYIDGDGSKLKRIFSNLIRNAADAMQNDHVKDPVIYIDTTRETDKIKITIKDTGPGIPEDILNSLFDAFVTRKKSTGTGLGLAIVKQFVLAHGGTIAATNDPGAVFTIHLPLSSGST